MPKYFSGILFLFLLFVFSGSALGFVPGSVLIVKSRYFSVSGPPDLNILHVLNKLDYDYFLQAESLLGEKNSNPKSVLAKTLDAIFLESCKILGINVHSFEAMIEFLADQSTVKIVIKELSGVDVNERAFYFHELKTIYVFLEDLSVGVLGHEMAHSVISYYFGAPPSNNIQEILAGYVDYSLRKSTGTLEP